MIAPTVLRPSNTRPRRQGPRRGDAKLLWLCRAADRTALSPLLEYLFNLGRQTGDAWIAQNGVALGQRSTMDLQQLLPGSIWNNI
jgi:hypothetical protein